MPVVRLRGVSFRYPGAQNWILREVSLEVGRGELVAVVGPSGSGKSTLLHLLGGLIRPTSGTVERPAEPDIRHVFQVPTILSRRTVEENVSIGLMSRRVVSADDRRAEVARALEDVGLRALSDRLGIHLSGGEAQRLQVARSFVSTPQLVLADEPTAQLDAASALSVGKALAAACGRDATSAVVATHDLRLAEIFGRRVVLRDGYLVES